MYKILSANNADALNKLIEEFSVDNTIMDIDFRVAGAGVTNCPPFTFAVLVGYRPKTAPRGRGLFD